MDNDLLINLGWHKSLTIQLTRPLKLEEKPWVCEHCGKDFHNGYRIFGIYKPGSDSGYFCCKRCLTRVLSERLVY